MKILVLNGPNLNLLGTRDQAVYGDETLEDLQKNITRSFPDHNFEFFQSNEEGPLINKIQEAMNNGTEALIMNPGGYSHTSVAIRDALEPLSLPKVEVHISNIHSRESFRQESLTGAVMDGIITGFGRNSYYLGIQAVEQIAKQRLG